MKQRLRQGVASSQSDEHPQQKRSITWRGPFRGVLVLTKSSQPMLLLVFEAEMLCRAYCSTGKFGACLLSAIKTWFEWLVACGVELVTSTNHMLDCI